MKGRKGLGRALAVFDMKKCVGGHAIDHGNRRIQLPSLLKLETPIEDGAEIPIGQKWDHLGIQDAGGYGGVRLAEGLGGGGVARSQNENAPERGLGIPLPHGSCDVELPLRCKAANVRHVALHQLL